MPGADLEFILDEEPDDGDQSLTIDGVSLRSFIDGVDRGWFELRPNPGEGTGPLASVASGGELSRVMLGLEVVLGTTDPVPTFVFDEVDAGVGGAAALEIGKRLSRLSRTCQVLVVTHLPQVAAFADRHLLVRKARNGEVTESGVGPLDGDDRIRELARMLGGMSESGSARAHAWELLDTAARFRAGKPVDLRFADHGADA
jgi:DNA repair protein RecN (Recombination protein N)